jgi:hypothetical protein
MKKSKTAAFETYARAQEVVRDLELTGISGTEVKVITDSEHDTKKNPSTSHSDGSKEKASPEFSDDSGGLTKQPYAGRTIVIVTPGDTRAAERVERHGGKSASGSGEPTAASQQDKPETTPARAVGDESSGLGNPGVTTGADYNDLEARGKEFRTPR